MTTARWQRVAIAVAATSGLLGLAASTGCTVLPKGPPSGAWVMHPIVVLLGVAAGFGTVARKQEIDRERWRVVADEALTSGEREYAHREAERDIRLSGTAFLLGAVGFGYWMAYQFNDEEEITAADFLIVTPLLGFVLGLLVGRRLFPEPLPGADG